MPDRIQEEVFAAVRRDVSTGEWVDLRTVTHYRGTTHEVRQRLERQDPRPWLERNPLVRIGRFDLMEKT